MPTTQSKAAKPSDDESHWELRALMGATILQAISLAVNVQATPILVSRLNKGDMSRTMSQLNLMTSGASLVEFCLNSGAGQLSDSFGRKPFFALAPLASLILRELAARRPNSFSTLLACRLITGGLASQFFNNINPVLVDVFGGVADEGERKNLITVWGARMRSATALGMIVGILLGGKLSMGGAASRSYRAAALMGGINLLVVTFLLRETLPVERRKPVALKGINPFAFLKLFTSSGTKDVSRAKLARLHVASCLQQMPMNMGPDIGQLFQKEKFGWTPEQNSRYMAVGGLMGVLSGMTAQYLQFLGDRITDVTQASAILSLLNQALAPTSNQYLLCLPLNVVGLNRTDALNSTITTAEAETGAWGMGELSAARANFLALAKTLAPVAYGKLFNFGRTKGVPGAPYLGSAVLLLVAQCLITAK